jgi:hypothetical protein
MVDKPSLHVVPPPNPFDPSALRLDVSYAEGMAVKKMTTTIPVRKPRNQDWVRVHPGEEYRLTVALIVLEDDKESYLVIPPLVPQLEGEWTPHVLYTTITRQGVLVLWPVRLPGPDGRQNEWWRSAHEGAAKAMKQWLRIKSNTNLGAYELYEIDAGSPPPPEPEWPTLSFADMLKIAFRDRLVDSVDHPVLKRLRGAA